MAQIKTKQKVENKLENKMETDSKMEYSYEIKIPKERVAVLIGTKGEAKRAIEQLTKTKLQIDSDEGDVVISGEDAITLYSTKEIIHAIGRGFNPDVARLLIKQDYSFELINIGDWVKTQNELERLRGRVIGEGGKSRKLIEDLTETSICVYGKTVGIIGQVEMVPLARRAIESLLSGSRHDNVYKWLERRRKEVKRATFEKSMNESILKREKEE
jgi:ribosomal RNA assembly protein